MRGLPPRGLLDTGVGTIYGNHMATPTKTTVYLDAPAYRRLRQLARAQRRPAAELVREAVAEYVRRRAPAQRPRSLGAAKSGRPDLGQRAEALLRGFGGG